MTRLRILGACALLVLGACKDSTGSEPKVPDLTVQVTATASAPTYKSGEEGEQLVECSITFVATVAGDASVKGRWTGGVLRYFVGTSTTAVDSLVMTGYEMSQAFGGDFASGEERRAGLGLLASVPFSLEIELRYRVNGVDAREPARARTRCGVPVGQPGALPVVSGVNVVPPAGDPEPGDTVRVSWTASGSPSLWETGVEVTGSFTAFHAVAGQGRGTITQSVDVVIPRDAVLGQPFQVRVYAADVWLRAVASPAWTSLPVMDRTPPQVFSVTTTRLRQPSLAGQYGVGDTMKVYAHVADNHGVTYMVYEFAPMGVRDSVAFRAGHGDAIPIPLGSALVGADGFRLWFRDASGNRTPDVAAAPGAIRVYPVRDVAVRTVPEPGRPEDIVVDPARNRLYALIENTNQLRVYSLPGLELVRTVALPSIYTGLDLTADGDSLLISSRLTPSLVVMDVNATAAPAAFKPQGVADLWGIRIASTGRAIALARMTDGRTGVLEVDLAAGTARVIVPSVTVREPTAGVARSRDRRKMVLGAGCVFDVQTEQVGPCRTMSTDGRGGPVSGGATGDAWGRTYELFGADLRSVWSLHGPDDDYALDLVPLAGGSAYVGRLRGTLRVRADGIVAERFTSTPLGTLRLSHDGTLMAGAVAAQGVYRIGVVDPR
ncbi:MAG: hypothetical protein KY467_03025 [Gemmatimonadetes bacterium]|nr:hypothetical protein [Gemmatimonadota bacterium]